MRTSKQCVGCLLSFILFNRAFLRAAQFLTSLFRPARAAVPLLTFFLSSPSSVFLASLLCVHSCWQHLARRGLLLDLLLEFKLVKAYLGGLLWIGCLALMGRLAWSARADLVDDWRIYLIVYCFAWVINCSGVLARIFIVVSVLLGLLVDVASANFFLSI